MIMNCQLSFLHLHTMHELTSILLCCCTRRLLLCIIALLCTRYSYCLLAHCLLRRVPMEGHTAVDLGLHPLDDFPRGVSLNIEQMTEMM